MTKTKYLLHAVLLPVSLFALHAAETTRSPQASAPVAATVLTEPADWRFEGMALPPGFAPDIKLAGVEEIRFAPGMFDPGSSDYFSYVVAVLADGAPELGPADLKDFLEKYYRGLSVAVGRGKRLSPDPKQMTVVVNPASADSKAKGRFVAEVVFFDSFSDGRKISLHVEAIVIPRPAARQTCAILLISPSSKDAPVWETLREIGGKAERKAGK
jgi:hypothetical protein